MNRLLLIITIFLTHCGNANAQHENVWAFSRYAGVDFNTNPPTPIQTAIVTKEGTASICDEDGQLLFYTDGNTVWNRRHFMMLNGSQLAGTGGFTESTSQGTIIIPVPGDSSKYYIFSLTSWESGRYNNGGWLYYSIVDMTLHSGLGGVAEKAVLLDSMLTEHMTAVSGNNCNVWLTVVCRGDNSFKSYNIDTGIAPKPIISPSVTPRQVHDDFYEWSGYIDFSPDRSKIAIAQEKVVLYDFDVNTGRMSNPIVLDTFPVELLSQPLESTFYGVCFSPDNSKLYATLPEVTHLTELSGLYQFDLQSGDSMTIINSKTRISRGKLYSMRRAPDGKIYCTGTIDTARSANIRLSSLNVIQQPNQPGANCQWQPSGFKLLEGTYSLAGLPNTGTIYTHRRFFSSTLDSSYCSNPRTLTARHTGGWEYSWNDGFTGTTRTVETPGTYWVQYKVPINSPCKYDIHVDTFRVVFALTSQYLSTVTRDSGMCKADRVKLEVSKPNGSGYLWENGDEGREREATFPGLFWVSYAVDSLCEFYRDSFLITYDDYEMAFEADSFACADHPIVFNNTSDRHYHAFNWSFGDGANSTLREPEHTYIEGRYRVMLTGEINAFCRDTAYHIVTVDLEIPAYFELQPDEICVGDKISVRHSMRDSSILELYWQMGDSSSSYVFDEWQQHAYDRDGVMYLTLDASFRACPPQAYKDSIIVHPLPVVDLGSDLALCLNGTPLLLYNKREMTPGNYAYLWNTGDTTAQLKVTHPGVYTMRVSSRPLGCSTSESVEVKKDCYIDIPNAFTPNGDGENDYFFPRQLLSKSVTRFSMKVFNRWGQVVFETDSVEGRGWDGRFNGKEQPVGVYVYQIEVELDGERNEKYEGNVTLLR